MQFQWDERKRRDVIESRDVDILYAARIFKGHVLTSLDDRKNYGEARFISVGMVGDECFFVVHTQRGDSIRLITAWKGSHDDKKRYQDSIA
jgi:uncharacterized DUF497 family protein